MPTPMTLGAIRSLALTEINALTALHPEIRPMLYRSGEWFFREADTSNEVFIVLRGTYAVENVAAGVVIDEMTCDVDTFSIVGEMAYLGGQARTASVRARTECHVLRLAPAHLETVIERFPMLTRVICRQFAIRLKAANEALRDLQSSPATEAPESAGPREARAHLIAPGSWNMQVGRKGTTLCGIRVPQSPSLLRQRERVGICPACEEVLDREGLWPKV